MKKSISIIVLVIVFCISASSQPGSIDPSFGKSGKLFFNFSNANSNNETGKKVFPLPDGKTIVAFSAGISIMTTRLLADGNTDTTYGNNGYSDFLPIRAVNAEMQPDGKIILVGFKFVMHVGYGSNYIAVGRLTADGKTDKTFNKDGFLVLNDYSATYGSVFTVQSDGKLLIGGQYEVSGSPPSIGTFLIRFNDDGSFDPTFGDNGVTKTSFPGTSYANFISLLINSENQITAIGTFKNSSFLDQCFLARYNSDGSLDTGFGVEGIKSLEFNLGTNLSVTLSAAALQTDEKILVEGNASDYSIYPYIIIGFVARLLPDGSLDSSFNGDGISTIDFYPMSIALQNSGKILLTGNGIVDNSLFVERLNSDGTIDTIFGNSGSIKPDINGNIISQGYILSATGSIFVTGSSYLSSGNSDCVVLKYNADGEPDTSFSTDGITTIFLEGGLSEVKGLFKLADGKLFCVGNESDQNFNSKVAFAKFLPDGSFDSSFGTDGRIITSLHNTGPSKIQQDGKILVASTENYIPKLSRFDDNGNLDLSFADSGLLSLPSLSDYNISNILSIEVQNDKKILALTLIISTVNFIEYSLAIYRFNQDGTPDAGFANNGIQIFPAGYLDYTGYKAFADAKILIRTDQKINVVGILLKQPSWSQTDKNLYIARLNSDGSFDTNFDGDGILISTFVYEWALSALVQGDNKIIVNVSNQLLRFDENGIPDIGFGTNGTVDYIDFGGTNSKIALQVDGKILKIGYSNYLGNLLYRFNSDGTVDTTFGNNGYVRFFDDIVYGYLTNILVSDNKVYAYGYANSPIQKAAIEAISLSDNLSISLQAKESNIKVWPNPSNQHFILKMNSNSNKPIELRVYDMVGRQAYSIKGPANRQYQFGGSFISGIYMVEVRQGGNRSTVKLIKQ